MPNAHTYLTQRYVCSKCGKAKSRTAFRIKVSNICVGCSDAEAIKSLGIGHAKLNKCLDCGKQFTTRMDYRICSYCKKKDGWEGTCYEPGAYGIKGK
jgi:transposase-like protein